MSETEVIDMSDLPQDVIVGTAAEAGLPSGDWPVAMSMAQILENVEKRVLTDACKRYRKQQDIAIALCMSQPTVARKLHKYGIGTPHDNR